MCLKNILLYILLLLAIVTNAQPPAKFYSTYGGNGYDVGYDVKQTLDGGYIITGSTSSFGQGNTDMYLLKLDSMGVKKFETSFGGVSNEIGKSVVQLIDSSYVIAGYTSSTGVGGYDFFLVKTDKTGALLWQKTIGGADWDFAYSMEATADGGFIIAGTTYSYGKGNADGYVVKTDGNGNVVWQKTYGGINDDEFKSVIQTADGNYALTGYTKSYNDIDSGDVWVFKLDLNGDSAWCKFYGGSKEDFGSGIIQLQNSNILITGGTRSNSINGNRETIIITFDYTSGNQTYIDIDNSSQDEYHNDVALGINGSIANCGATKNAVFGYDALVDIYKPSFNFLNFFSEGSNMYEEFFSINQTKDKGFVAIGKTTGYGSVLEDIFFMKMDSLGSFGTSIIGIEEKVYTKIEPKIYPNPTTDYINVKVSNFKIFRKLNYQVVDLNGRVVLSNTINELIKTIDVSFLSDGLYLLQIFDSNNLLSCSKISVIK